MAVASRRPSVPVTELGHSAFRKTKDELPSTPLGEEMVINVRWQRISSEYLLYTAEEFDHRIGKARNKLGKSVTILGHHYQREEVIKYADFRGDSYLLSREAANRTEADYIIFCFPAVSLVWFTSGGCNTIVPVSTLGLQ